MIGCCSLSTGGDQSRLDEEHHTTHVILEHDVGTDSVVFSCMCQTGMGRLFLLVLSGSSVVSCPPKVRG